MTELSATYDRNTLRQILVAGDGHWNHDGYEPDARRRFRRAVQCRTPALGGRVYASDTEEREFSNTCKSPACTSCGHWRTVQWQRERWCALPETSYRVITFTMPNTLWPLFAANPHLCRKLAEIAARVLISFARVYKGVEVGVMPVVHTFNGKLEFNSHVHTLVTASDLQTSRAERSSIYFDSLELKCSWKRLVILLLRVASGARQFKSVMTAAELELLLQQEERRPWCEPKVQNFSGKEHFLRYAGRYARRPPIPQRRILRVADGLVWFWYKDKRRRELSGEKQRHDRETVCCTVEEFIDRWAQHIPKRYRHAVRQFGLFASRRWAQAATAVFTLLGTKQRPKPKRCPWALAIQQQFGRNPLLDSKGQLMKWVRHVAPITT
jgi:hypothetical protein